MKKRNFQKRPSDSHEPKAVGEILDEILRSDSRFAASYRRYKEAVNTEEEVENDRLYPDSHLCVDVKVFSTKPGRMPMDTFLEGYFTRSSEDQFLLSEKAVDKKLKTLTRNPVIFAGDCVNVHMSADGTKRLYFNRPRFSSKFTFNSFCLAAAQELLTIARLLGEEDSQE